MASPKDLLLSVLGGSAVDRPPFVIPGGMMNMAVTEAMDELQCGWPEAHSDPAKMARLARGMAELCGLDNVGVPFCMTVEAESMGAEVYLGTRETEPRVMRYPLENIENWPTLKPLTLGGRAGVVLDAIALLKGSGLDRAIIGNLTGPVSLATSLIEPVDFYKAMRRNKPAVHQFLRAVTESLIRFGEAQIQAGADVITISDPSGTGEILGPPMFREFAIPYLNEIVRALNPRVPTIIHICGRLESVLGDLNSLESNAISVDSITHLREVRVRLRGKALMGNVSTFVLDKGAPEKVYQAGLAAIQQGAQIVAPACGIGAETPLANLRSLAACVRGEPAATPSARGGREGIQVSVASGREEG
jgi:[methyl-Co(III) methanol-specific corrinoid protein]:coenzyme M methyltransferase